MSFVHLQVHSEFTMGESIVRIDALIDRVKELNMPAVAITDTHNLFAVVKFFNAAIKAGIKPIIGAEVECCATAEKKAFRVTLLCQNQNGYKNLMRLLSRGYVEGQIDAKPTIQYSWLQEAFDGLFIVIGPASDAGQMIFAQDHTAAKDYLNTWKNDFPERCFLQCQRVLDRDYEYTKVLIELAKQLALPLIAGNDVRFLEPDDFLAMEARYCIHTSDTLARSARTAKFHPKQYLLSQEEMHDLFQDIPESLSNTVLLAHRCNVQLTLGTAVLPEFPIPSGTTIETYLKQLAIRGLEKRLQQLFGAEAAAQVPVYQERLELELQVINRMGYPGYFLIVADFIQWAKNNGVPVGPGRGSGAGSLVAYVLGITDLDPLKYALLFERFLNPERISMPDFDIDFCMEGRDRVIDYVAERYGRHAVSQIITFGTMAAKAVVRDVGRVLGHPYGFVDKIAKLIPFEIGITLERALDQEAELARRYHEEEEVKTLIDLAKRLEGITRNAGKHAGGVVIAPANLTDFSPLYCEAGGANLVTQFDKDDVEAVGLVKFDFLGLRTLTIIDWALKIINEQRQHTQLEPLQIETIPLDDVPTFDLLKQCNTTAVFQLESRGMKDLIKRLQPDCFEDIIALVALFRPGPLQSGMVDDFINRKQGRANIEYLHPDLEPILKTTYGVILYQEQVMQIAQSLAGYTLGAADLLRRAMGKKKPEEMAKQRDIFTQGAVANKIDRHIATTIFDLMEKFAGYGFNKSHSAAYALVAYQTAWFKAHYPAAFMAAVLSSDMDNTDKVVTFIRDCQQTGLTIASPDINQSEYYFTVLDQKIIYGLGAIKGVGQAAIESIVAARKQSPYTDLFDFCQRGDPRKANRRVLDALIYSGAMDKLGPDRATLLAIVDDALKTAEQQRANSDAGQHDLFSEEKKSESTLQYPSVQALSPLARLNGEKATLGFYLTGHPIDYYQAELSQFTMGHLADLPAMVGRTVSIAGFVMQVRKLFTKKGKRMAVVTLDDNSARVDVLLFSELLDEVGRDLEPDTLIVISGQVSRDDFSGNIRMTAERVNTLAALRSKSANQINITLTPTTANDSVLLQLKSVLSQYNTGHLPLTVFYQTEQYTGQYKSMSWTLDPSDACLLALESVCGAGMVAVGYGVST